MLKFGVVGDDITGCVDIGLMFHKGGMMSDVFTKDSKPALKEQIDVIIIDSDSRFLSQRDAYQRVYDRTLELKALGATQFYKKTCSVFRGNIGAEFDAMLDALHEDTMLVVAGFPETGRTTVHSVHYVDGIRLDKSQFQFDPMNPMKQANIKQIIQEQSNRPVSSIWWEELDKGVSYIKQRIQALRKEKGYICVDVRDRHDLTLLANAIEDIHVFGGSSALALELAKINQPSKLLDHEAINDNTNGILACCGSVTKQSYEQVCFMKQQTTCFLHAIDPQDVISASGVSSNVIEQCVFEWKQGRDVLLYVLGIGEVEQVRYYQELAKKKGLTAQAFGNQLAELLADYMLEISKRVNQTKLIFAGGDTSFHCCQKFQIQDLLIQKEIEAGIPLCRGVSSRTYDIVLKSGSFGSEDFFLQAIRKLKETKV